ncbi:MAG: VWA domain-containing protein [Polyangiaceae bacterium]|nr:VWA domain-containing protein [Polyangiaceae bacterium]
MTPPPHPEARRGVALGVVILSVTGLLLARGGVAPHASPSDRSVDEPPQAFAAAPPTRERATRAEFSRGLVSGSVALSHGKLLAGGTRSMFLELRARGRGDEQARAPLAMVLVVDTSGSMAGPKIVDARRAAAAAIDEMQDDDLVSVVRFSDDAEVLVPLGRVADVRARARGAVERLHAAGNTNISRAVEAAAAELSKAGQGRATRVALVTDGRDTSGAPRGAAATIARRESSRGVTVSTLGIGVDYDDAYLADLASAGHGNYEFMRDASALGRFLSRELRETAHTSARRVAFDLELPPGARVRDVWGATVDGSRITLGALFAGDERRVIVPIEVPVGASGEALTFGARVSWLAADARVVEVATERLEATATSDQAAVEEGRDARVHAAVTSVESSRRSAEAAAAFERGDRATAIALNDQSRRALAQAAAAAPSEARGLGAQARAYEGDAKTYRASPPAPAAARAIGARERSNLPRAAAY